VHRSTQLTMGAAVLSAVLVLTVGAAAARVYTLEECVGTALEKNISLAKAREGLVSSNASVLSSWSGVLPRVSAGVSASDQRTVSGGIVGTGTGRSASVGVSQSVFDGSTWARISSASHNRDADALSLESTRRDIVFSTQQSYYNLLKAVALRGVASEALDLAREQLRKTQSLFDLGSASKADLLTAQVQVGQAELSLITAQQSAETSRAALCYTIGIDVTTDLEAVDPPEFGEPIDTESYDLDAALARRPDVQAAEESLVAARRSLLADKAARWPDLSASLSYSRSEGTFGDLFDNLSDNHNRSASLSLSIPIFNGLATKAGIDAGKAQLRIAELSVRDARLSAQYDIEVARLAVTEQVQRVTVSENALAQADEDLKVTEERYRLRAASMLELIDARVAYSQARADLVEARYDSEIAKRQFRLALGYGE
jgi:outer membrane protein TolC